MVSWLSKTATCHPNRPRRNQNQEKCDPGKVEGNSGFAKRRASAESLKMKAKTVNFHFRPTGCVGSRESPGCRRRDHAGRPALKPDPARGVLIDNLTGYTITPRPKRHGHRRHQHRDCGGNVEQEAFHVIASRIHPTRRFSIGTAVMARVSGPPGLPSRGGCGPGSPSVLHPLAAAWPTRPGDPMPL